ncbi:MAG: DNA repair protein RecO [Rhodospirillales bacterium]|nr:DNA repair protein RecO [Rhodospirillales bacterium]
MEWDEPGIILSLRAYGEADAIANVLTPERGAHRGLARGALSRRGAATWQPGNAVQVRWVGRLADQLGTYSAELVHAAAALAMDDRLALALLAAACAVADGALPEREAHPRVFEGLLRLVAGIPAGALGPAALIRWEALLLADLGYGMDLSRCAVSGGTEGLAWVSPRTGRAVSDAAAGIWKERLLRLPALLVEAREEGGTKEDGGTKQDWRDGLRLTGHFLARDAFGIHHRPLPQPRLALYDLIEKLAGENDAG